MEAFLRSARRALGRTKAQRTAGELPLQRLVLLLERAEEGNVVHVRPAK
jgi:hypothetical protein